jgi:hypothetical protein
MEHCPSSRINHARDGAIGTGNEREAVVVGGGRTGLVGETHFWERGECGDLDRRNTLLLAR